MASIVCGMTPSSAATTSTTMSVTLAPRARMAVKASWPGVSRKVILLAVVQSHLIGADVLGDAAGFAATRHSVVRMRVEQRGLAVVDVAHDGDDRRPRLQCSSTSSAPMKPSSTSASDDAAHGVAEFGGHQFGGVGVDDVVDLQHHALTSSGT